MKSDFPSDAKGQKLPFERMLVVVGNGQFHAHATKRGYPYVTTIPADLGNGIEMHEGVIGPVNLGYQLTVHFAKEGKAFAAVPITSITEDLTEKGICPHAWCILSKNEGKTK